MDAFDVMLCCGNWPRRDAVDAFDAIVCVVVMRLMCRRRQMRRMLCGWKP